MPTLMGYDADHSIADGEVGVCGVSISSMQDMEILFDGINLSEISSVTLTCRCCVIGVKYRAVPGTVRLL